MSDFVTNLVDMAWGRAVVAQPQRLSRFDPTPFQAGLLGQNPVISPAGNERAAPEELDVRPSNWESPIGEPAPLNGFSPPVKRPPIGPPADRPTSSDGVVASGEAGVESASNTAQTPKIERRTGALATSPAVDDWPGTSSDTLSPVREDSPRRRPLPASARQSAAQPVHRPDAASQPAALPVDATSLHNKVGWYEAAHTWIASVAQSQRRVATDETGAPALLSSNAERLATIRQQTDAAALAHVEGAGERIQTTVSAGQPAPEVVRPTPSPVGERKDSDRFTQAQDGSQRLNWATKDFAQSGAISEQPGRPASRVTVTPQLVPLPRNDSANARTSPRLSDQQATAEPPAPPTIYVSIGRVEVRATPPPPAPVRKPSPRPTLSLDDYLRGRKEGNR